MSQTPIKAPASFIPSQATAYSDVDGTAINVSVATPLPVNFTSSAPMSVSVANASPVSVALAYTGATPLAGTTASASAVLGPYQPALGRAVMLALSGTWAGTVKITRSTDGGTTRLPLTAAGTTWGQYTSNACEPVWEESDGTARLYLEVALTSGTLTYRIAQ